MRSEMPPHPLLEPRTLALGLLYLLGYSVALTLAYQAGNPVFAELVKIGGIVTPALFGGSRVVQELTRKVETVEAVKAETEAQTADIKQIKGNLNGALDRRLNLIEMAVIAIGEDVAEIKTRLPAKGE